MTLTSLVENGHAFFCDYLLPILIDVSFTWPGKETEGNMVAERRFRMQGTLDGGLSWLVVFGSFMSQFAVLGIHFVFGLLYIDLLNEFGQSKATTGENELQRGGAVGFLEWNSSVTLENSQLVCFWLVGIFNLVMFIFKFLFLPLFVALNEN